MDVTACYPKVKYRSKSSGSVSNAGMLLLTETARPTAVHLPGRAICDLASDQGTAITGIAAARAYARAAAGLLQGGALPEVGDHLIVDLDASLVSSHS